MYTIDEILNIYLKTSLNFEMSEQKINLSHFPRKSVVKMRKVFINLSIETDDDVFSFFSLEHFFTMSFHNFTSLAHAGQRRKCLRKLEIINSSNSDFDTSYENEKRIHTKVD